MARHALDWSFGLINSAGRYLTQESGFNNKLVATAKAMKKKQIFFLEQVEGQAHVYIRTPLGKYLSVDQDGKFTGGAAAKGDEEALVIETLDTGEWCLKSQKYGWYCGGNGENLTAFTTDGTAADRKWRVHLAMHPFVCMRNVKRGRYVHVTGDGTQLTTDEGIPWGHDATIFIEYLAGSGAYRLTASNGKCLGSNGALGEAGVDKNFLYIIIFDGGKVSFRSLGNGNYVTSLGANGLCKAAKKTITKDEQYVLEDSYPQLTFRSANDDKYISVAQGIEVACKCDRADIGDREIFQVEPSDSGTWIIKSSNDKLWKVTEGSVHSTGVEGKTCDANTAPLESQFTIEFEVSDSGSYVLISHQGKYLTQQMNGYIKARGDDRAEKACQFAFDLVNRPRIVLRGSYGFVATLPSGLLECNKSAPELFNVTTNGQGLFALEHSTSGKFWKVGANGISCTGTEPEYYSVVLKPHSKMSFTFEGKLIHGAQNGALTASGTKDGEKTAWEY